MTTKFTAAIHKYGNQNSAILKMIARHNEGIEPMGIADFLSFQSIQRSLDNDTEKNFCIERDENDECTFHVSEDGGKTVTLSVREITIHTLDEMATEFGEKYNDI